MCSQCRLYCRFDLSCLKLESLFYFAFRLFGTSNNLLCCCFGRTLKKIVALKWLEEKVLTDFVNRGQKSQIFCLAVCSCKPNYICCQLHTVHGGYSGGQLHSIISSYMLTLIYLKTKTPDMTSQRWPPLPLSWTPTRVRPRPGPGATFTWKGTIQGVNNGKQETLIPAAVSSESIKPPFWRFLGPGQPKTNSSCSDHQMICPLAGDGRECCEK